MNTLQYSTPGFSFSVNSLQELTIHSSLCEYSFERISCECVC